MRKKQLTRELRKTRSSTLLPKGAVFSGNSVVPIGELSVLRIWLETLGSGVVVVVVVDVVVIGAGVVVVVVVVGAGVVVVVVVVVEVMGLVVVVVVGGETSSMSLAEGDSGVTELPTVESIVLETGVKTSTKGLIGLGGMFLVPESSFMKVH